jgi:hypothetical protein
MEIRPEGALAQDFDWISERHACSPTQAFIALREQVMEDVKKRSAFMKDSEKERYEFHTGTQDWLFWVSVNGSYVEEKGVSFHRSRVGIEVRDTANNNLLIEGVLTLGADGECKLKVGEKLYSFWQFRMLALEDILFTSVAKLRL